MVGVPHHPLLPSPPTDCLICAKFALDSGITPYRGTSLIRNTPLLGHYSRTIPRVLWLSYGWGLFLMSEVPLYTSGLVRYGVAPDHADTKNVTAEFQGIPRYRERILIELMTSERRREASREGSK